MSGELDIGQIPDRPATPSTSSESSRADGDVKPRANREEDVTDGEAKPSDEPQDGKSEPTSKSQDGTGAAPRKKAKKPVVDYVRPDISPNKASRTPTSLQLTPHLIFLSRRRTNYLLKLWTRLWRKCV